MPRANDGCTVSVAWLLMKYQSKVFTEFKYLERFPSYRRKKYIYIMKYDGAVLKIFSNDYQMLYKKSSTRKTEHEVINQQ